MSKQINIESYRTTGSSGASSGSGSGNGFGGTSSSGSGSGVSKHNELKGVISSDDNYSDSARDIHLTAADADELKRIASFQVITSTDEEAIPTDENIYSALKSKQEDEKIREEADNKYLRKDIPDATPYLLGMQDGATFGNYLEGFLGSGARIDARGDAEMTSLKLREFLEVPELRFNRIDVVSGELWNAVAFGLIESVDEVNRIVTLKLEEGELSGMHVSDFCRGIFHNLTDNETEPGTDAAGFEVMVGFRTSYFTPVQILDNEHFKYELKPGSVVHPCPAMKFAVYGNAVDKNRQASAYHTRTYTRYLRDVSTWEINPGKHVSMQLGDLSGLVINGESLAEGSVYLNNVYFGGNIRTVGGLDDQLKGQDAYSVTLSAYSAVYNLGDDTIRQSEVTTADKNVLTADSQVLASQFNITTRLQVTKGAEQLRFSTIIGAGKYVVASTGTNCTYIISDGIVAIQAVTADRAEVKMEVNCEGMALYNVTFTIVRVSDGRDGKDYEYIFTRTQTYSRPAAPATSQVDDYVPTGWTDDAAGPTMQLPFEWCSKRTKVDGVWGAFSSPSLWSRFSEDGSDHEFIFRRTTSNSQPATPGTSQSDDFVPSGWTDDPTGVTSSYPYEWMCKRNKLKGVWSIFTTPALWAKYGFDGQDGANGADGRPGADGKPGTNGAQGPFVTNRGEYDGTKTYYGSPERIDIVYNKSNNSYYKTRTTAGSFSGVSPTNTTKWELFQGQFENIATGFLFAKEALISSFWFGANRIESQKRDVIIDGNDNGNPRIALGANFNNISNAPTRLYADGRIETSKLVAKDGSDIGNFRISNGKLSNKPNTFAMVQMTDTNMEVTLGTDLVPATAGGAFTLLGRIKNNITSGDAYFRTENIGLELSAQNASVNTALSCPSGNVKINEGSLVVNERSYYSNEGYLNSITANFKNKRTFIFQPTSYNTVMLPSRAEIQTAVGLWDAGHNTGIEIKILITRWATNSINLQGGANAVIIDGRGNIPKDNNSVAHNNGNINLGRGNNCTLYYWNEGWYLTSLNR